MKESLSASKKRIALVRKQHRTGIGNEYLIQPPVTNISKRPIPLQLSLTSHPVWEQRMQRFCLGRYGEAFVNEFFDCIRWNPNSFTLKRLHDFEKEIIGVVATLKHEKYEKFVRKYTQFKEYQSVFHEQKHGPSPPSTATTVQAPTTAEPATSISDVFNHTDQLADTPHRNVDHDVGTNVEHWVDDDHQRPLDKDAETRNEKCNLLQQSSESRIMYCPPSISSTAIESMDSILVGSGDGYTACDDNYYFDSIAPYITNEDVNETDEKIVSFQDNSKIILENSYDEIKHDYDWCWDCYNCGQNRNSVVDDSHCKSCNLGINPFKYFISNERNLRECDYPLLTKKFGLIKGKIGTSHNIPNERTGQFCLRLNNSQYLTFICENATEFDLQVIMFQWSLYVYFGDKSYVFEANPREIKYLFENENSSYITGTRNIDVNREGRLLSGCKARDHYVVSFGSKAPTESRRQHFDSASISPALPARDYIGDLTFASKKTAIIELVNEIIGNGYESDLILTNAAKDQATSEYPLNVSVLPVLVRKYKIFDILDEKLRHSRHEMIGKPLAAYPVLLLALILYTGDGSTCDLSYSSRINDFTKWPVFLRCVETGIFLLSKFERFNNVKMYAGLCDAKLRVDNDGDETEHQVPRLRSFATTLGVAKGFRGYEGTILGIHLDDSNNDNYCCADVSWISEYPGEKEVLFVNLPIKFEKEQCIIDESKRCQWINLTPDQSVDEMFPSSVMNCDGSWRPSNGDNNQKIEKNRNQHSDWSETNKQTNFTTTATTARTTTTDQLTECVDASTPKPPIILAPSISSTNAITKVPGLDDVNGNSNINPSNGRAPFSRDNSNSNINSTPTKSGKNNLESGDTPSKPGIASSVDSSQFNLKNKKQVFTFYVVFNWLLVTEEYKKQMMDLIQREFRRSGIMYEIGEALLCRERILAKKVSIYVDGKNEHRTQSQSPKQLERIFRQLQAKYRKYSNSIPLFSLKRRYKDIVNGYGNQNFNVGGFGLGCVQKYSENIDRYLPWLLTQRRSRWLSIKDRIRISKPRYLTLMQHIGNKLGNNKLRDEINKSEILKCKDKFRDAVGVYSFKVEQCNPGVPVEITQERAAFEQKFADLKQLSILIDIVALSFTVGDANESECKSSSADMEWERKTENDDVSAFESKIDSMVNFSDVKNDEVDTLNGSICENIYSPNLSFLKICLQNLDLLDLKTDDFKLSTVIKWLIDVNNENTVKEYVGGYLCISCPVTIANLVKQTELYKSCKNDHIITLLENAPFVISLLKNNIDFIDNQQQSDRDRFKSLNNYKSVLNIITLLQFAIARRIIKRFLDLMESDNRFNPNQYFDTFCKYIRKDTRMRRYHLVESFALSYCNVFKRPKNCSIQIHTKDGSWQLWSRWACGRSSESFKQLLNATAKQDWDLGLRDLYQICQDFRKRKIPLRTKHRIDIGDCFYVDELNGQIVIKYVFLVKESVMPLLNGQVCKKICQHMNNNQRILCVYCDKK